MTSVMVEPMGWKQAMPIYNCPSVELSVVLDPEQQLPSDLKAESAHFAYSCKVPEPDGGDIEVFADEFYDTQSIEFWKENQFVRYRRRSNGIATVTMREVRKSPDESHLILTDRIWKMDSKEKFAFWAWLCRLYGLQCIASFQFLRMETKEGGWTRRDDLLTWLDNDYSLDVQSAMFTSLKGPMDGVKTKVEELKGCQLVRSKVKHYADKCNLLKGELTKCSIDWLGGDPQSVSHNVFQKCRVMSLEDTSD